jgi:hypothetical protein
MLSPHKSAFPERLAPVDEYGVPYAIYPYDAPKDTLDTRVNDDHAFYRKQAPELQGPGGRMLIYARVHEVEVWAHDRKHRLFPDGLERYPVTEQEQFLTGILLCAGYLSRWALDVRKSGEWSLQYMRQDVYDYMRGRQKMHFQTEINSRIPREAGIPRRTQDTAVRNIGMFLTDYARRQDLTHLKDEDFVDEFLNTPDTLRRYQLARVILREAARVAVEPLKPDYQEALQEGLLRTSEPDPTAIITRFSFPGGWDEHVAALHDRLAA